MDAGVSIGVGPSTSQVHTTITPNAMRGILAVLPSRHPLFANRAKIEVFFDFDIGRRRASLLLSAATLPLLRSCCTTDLFRSLPLLLGFSADVCYDLW